MPLEMPEKDNTFVLKVSLTLGPNGPLAAPDYLPRGRLSLWPLQGEGPSWVGLSTLHRCQAPHNDLNLGPGFRTKCLGVTLHLGPPILISSWAP